VIRTVNARRRTSRGRRAGDLFPRLGIAEKINVKVMLRGSDATGLVASGGR
jgi:hypothetical protein